MARVARLLPVDALVAARINPDVVRSYDIRGCVGRQLGLEDAHTLGLAHAAVARSRGKRHIAVCRDGRLTSPELESALVTGLVEGGMQVRSADAAGLERLQRALMGQLARSGIQCRASL